MSDYLSILFSAFVLLFSGIFAKSENACQKDYYFAADIQITPSVTATETPDDGDGDDDTLTPTATPTPEDVTIETPTPVEVSTGTPSPTPEVTAAAQEPFLRSGKEIFSEIEKSAAVKKVEDAIRSSIDLKGGSGGNWLGKQAGSEASLQDADGDGFTDGFEISKGSDPGDRRSLPDISTTTSIQELLAADKDGDGLSSKDETVLEVLPSKYDSDGDGCGDGSEVLSFSDPRNGESFPSPDSDRDCLSNDFEKKWNLRADLADTDGDNLNDAKEIAFGTNPFSVDTDGDGITDGKEVALLSNPLAPD